MGASWHQSAMDTVPTAIVTGHLLCQVWFPPVGSSLVLTRTLGSVYHYHSPLPTLLLAITVTRSQSVFMETEHCFPPHTAPLVAVSCDTHAWPETAV